MHGAREECKNVCVSGRVEELEAGSSRREDEPDLRRVLSATLSCVETEDGEEEEAMIYKGASLPRAIGQLEGKRGSSYQNFTVGIAQPRCDLAREL